MRRRRATSDAAPPPNGRGSADVGRALSSLSRMRLTSLLSRHASVVVLAVVALVASPSLPERAFAGPVPSASAEASAIPTGDLPPLPEPEPIRMGELDPSATKDLDALLAQLVSSKEDIREHARAALDETPATLLPSIHARIEEIHGTYDKKIVPRLLDDARRAAKDKRKAGKDDLPHDTDKPKKKKKHTKDKSADDGKAPKDKKVIPDEDGDAGDWLAIVESDPRPEDESWQKLVQLLGMERMLAGMATTPSLMEMIDLRASFGDMLRIDLQRQVERLGDKAVAALIESRNHKASVVRDFAEKELDKMGRSIPGEAVASDDPDILADVLRAFGHTRDVDAVHVALSYAGNDRRKLRDAARQAIVGIGDAGKWQLREAYQDLTGDKPDKSASWDLLARQIFAIYDRARLAAFEKVVTAGMTAQAAGNHADAVKAFDQVLAEDPLFDKRKAMAPSYAALAATLGVDRAEDKLSLLRKAQRLDPDGKDANRIGSQIALTEAQLLIRDHRPDRFLLERAVELDPDNLEAKDLLASFQERAVEQKSNDKRRFAAAAAIFAAMLAGVGAIGLLGRRKRPPPKSAAPAAPAA